MKLISRFFLAFIFAFPIVNFAQSVPSLQVGSLATDKGEYEVGQTIRGNAEVFNIGGSNAEDIYYVVSYGEYGQKGGTLANAFTVGAVEGPINIQIGQSQKVNFAVKPEVAVENAGVDIVFLHQNGSILAWKKVPLEVAGESVNEFTIVSATLNFDGEDYPTMSGPTAYEESDAKLMIRDAEGSLSGEVNVKLAIYDRTVTGEKVYDQTVRADFEEGVASIDLPKDLQPESYLGTFYLEKDGQKVSNTMSFRYVIDGVQAEILDISASKSVVGKGDMLNLLVTYIGSPLSINSSDLPEPLEAPAMRISVLNENGREIATYDGSVKQNYPEYPEITEDNYQDPAILGKVEAALDAYLEPLIESVNLEVSGKGNGLTFNVEIYNSNTGEVYDTYTSTVPGDVNAGIKLFDIAFWLIIILVIAIVLIIIRLIGRGHKNHAVATFIVGVGVIASVTIVNNGRNADAMFIPDAPKLQVASPTSSLVGGYDPGAPMDLDLTYTQFACANNGIITLRIGKPIDDSWHNFTSSAEAIDGIKNSTVAGHWEWEAYDPPLKVRTRGGYRYIYYHLVWVGPTTSDSYETITKNTSTWADSGAYWGDTFLNVTGSFTAPSEPGKYYIPLSYQYCTGSHGCIGKQYTAYEVCVNGAGLCPGEDIDYCSNVPGNQYYQGGVVYEEDQTPTDYIRNADGTCSHTGCNPPPPDFGQTCGCADTGIFGTIQCDGSCQTDEGQTIPASCTSCNTDHTEDEICTVTNSCGEDVSGYWQCTPTGWQCGADTEANCDGEDVCSNLSGTQLTVPEGYIGNPDGTCDPVTGGSCELAGPTESYCVELYDSDGRPTYEGSGISQADYDQYFKDEIESSTYYNSEDGVVVTDHTIYGIIKGSTGPTCDSELCTPGAVAHKTGCINSPSGGGGARCYSETIDNPYKTTLDLRVFPDQVAPGELCNIVWTSQDTEFCNLATSSSGGIVSYSTAGSYSILMGDESVNVRLSCRGLDGETYAKQDSCNAFGEFSEI